MGAEANRERITYLAGAPDLGRLLRTLLRLRHDLVMIGRAVVEPLPEACQTRLGPAVQSVADAAAYYLQESAVSLLARRAAPPIEPVETAMDAYAAEIRRASQGGHPARFTRRKSRAYLCAWFCAGAAKAEF